MHRRWLLILLLILAWAPAAYAHEIGESEGPHDVHELWKTWGWEPLPLAGLALSAFLYARGTRLTWKKSGVGHGIARWEAGCFAGGWFALFVALISPLHPWGQVLFSAHMTQHEILMLVAAPLLVLSRPMIAFLRALPPHWAQKLARLSNQSWWRSAWSTVSTPFAAFLIHGLTLWLWHAPALFSATLHNEWIHAAQHTSFLFTALLFWWAVIHVPDRLMGYGVAILYLFITALHSNILGALITFARAVWYPDYASTAPDWGLTGLQDQQLGGLIMWVPAGIVYIIAGLALMAGWMRESEQRVRRREIAMEATP